METPPPPLAPLKIVPEKFVDTPSSSVSVSPTESCPSDARKQRKAWERTASLASSFDTSEEDEVDCDDEEPMGSTVLTNSAKTTVQSLRMQTLVQTMQQRLGGLQRLVLEAATQDKIGFQIQERANAERRSNPGKISDEHTVVGDAVEPAHVWSQLASVSPSKRLPMDGAADKVDESRVESASEDGASSRITTLRNRVVDLEAQLKEAADENQQLQNTVRKLEEENARLQCQTAPQGFHGELNGDNGSTNSGRGQDFNTDEYDKAGDGDISRLTTAFVGYPSAFQVDMEEDLAVLKNHERCQHKLHELWETIRTLKTFVETHELERDTMRTQRDEAIVDAERADAENVKLTCSSNPQRKIKYLEQMKQDNQALRRKNRALNVKIAKQTARLIREKNGSSLLVEEDGEAFYNTQDSATFNNKLLQELDESFCKRIGEEVLHKMRDRRGVLELRLGRLRLERQNLQENGTESDLKGGLELSSAEILLAATSVR